MARLPTFHAAAVEEHEEVIIVPAEGVLDGMVQNQERGPVDQQEPPLDARLDFEKGYLEVEVGWHGFLASLPIVPRRNVGGQLFTPRSANAGVVRNCEVVEGTGLDGDRLRA